MPGHRNLPFYLSRRRVHTATLTQIIKYIPNKRIGPPTPIQYIAPSNICKLITGHSSAIVARLYSDAKTSITTGQMFSNQKRACSFYFSALLNTLN